jgi:hypothetical protein
MKCINDKLGCPMKSWFLFIKSNPSSA